MEIRVNIPDEIAAQARARGLEPEVYVEELLAQQVGNRAARAPQSRTPEEIRTWLDSLAQFSDKIPPLPETISRADAQPTAERSRASIDAAGWSSPSHHFRRQQVLELPIERRAAQDDHQALA